MYKSYIKPLMDFFVSLLLLIVAFPLLVLVTLFLCFTNNGKPFFFQLRPGKNGEIFTIIKFKTMNDKKDEAGNLLLDASRLTVLGQLVRKTSLDELPQLINVLKGEMSLIGPRPLLPEYLAIYSENQKKRHNVKPGITGWGQVNGRNSINWSQKFEYDLWYVDHLNFLLDLKIIFLTVSKVFKREGITAENSVSAKAFNGNN
jgi:undecaprenyl phosphate N,N'-diacetylbacillosamine 1-phosphate transferase